jgi:hypothetical protein
LPKQLHWSDNRWFKAIMKPFLAASIEQAQPFPACDEVGKDVLLCMGASGL